MSIGQSSDKSASAERVVTVSFCDLVTKPELYKDKIVRVRATYFANIESTILYDLKCDTKDNYLWFMLECDSDSLCNDMRDKINKNLEGDPFSGMRADMTVIGQLKYPKPNHRYGVQGGFRLGFATAHIEQATPIPLSTPMPKGNAE